MGKVYSEQFRADHEQFATNVIDYIRKVLNLLFHTRFELINFPSLQKVENCLFTEMFYGDF